MRFLLFQIYAPLVSWGEIAVGGERQSSRYPSKSSVLGLIAASLGIKREEEKRLNDLAESLGIAVQLHSGGSVLKDFHTVQVPRSKSKIEYHTRREELLGVDEKDNAIISRREYRCDALSVVAVYLKDNVRVSKENEIITTIQDIENALREPHFHLYFGRKSCVPGLPLDPKPIDATSLKEAFEKYCVSAIEKVVIPIHENKKDLLKKAFEQYPQKTLTEDTLTYFWEEGIDSGFKKMQSVERYDEPLSRKRWQFTSRREYMAIIKKGEASDVFQ